MVFLIVLKIVLYELFVNSINSSFLRPIFCIKIQYASELFRMLTLLEFWVSLPWISSTERKVYIFIRNYDLVCPKHQLLYISSTFHSITSRNENSKQNFWLFIEIQKMWAPTTVPGTHVPLPPDKIENKEHVFGPNFTSIVVVFMTWMESWPTFLKIKIDR